MSDTNRRKALAEVVTAEAWHAMFKPNRTQADLHVDVVFGAGRIGGGDSSGIRFRLSVRRAEVIVIVPEHEPVAIDKVSVRRDAPQAESGKIESKVKTRRSASLAAGAGLGANEKGTKAHAEAKAQMALAASKECAITATQAQKGMVVTQSQTTEGHYRWLVEPALAAMNLGGRPWDAAKTPRLRLMDQRPAGSKSMPPIVRIEVRCLREDLEITNITVDDDKTWNLLKRRKAHETRRIAAEAAIRAMLTEEGLVVGDMADPYAPITLAMTIADAV